MIDSKDLRLINSLSEIKPGAIFYRRDDKGNFERCVIEENELKDAMRREILRFETQKFLDLKILFTRINKPWKSFNE